MKITPENALTADNFEHASLKNADKTPLRTRRSGKTQVWKKRPGHFKIPVKYGLYESTYITHENCDQWYIPEQN